MCVCVSAKTSVSGCSHTMCSTLQTGCECCDVRIGCQTGAVDQVGEKCRELNNPSRRSKGSSVQFNIIPNLLEGLPIQSIPFEVKHPSKRGVYWAYQLGLFETSPSQNQCQPPLCVRRSPLETRQKVVPIAVPHEAHIFCFSCSNFAVTNVSTERAA